MDWQSSPPRRTRMANWFGIIGLSVVLIVPVSSFPMASLDWFLVKRALRLKFRDVRWITTSELSGWLTDANRSQPILLDVRSRAEWEVSHLPRAHWVDPHSDPATALAGIARETPIVTYCSVGYRSATAARRLRTEGYDRVQNLEGSIFAWANEGRPLARGDQLARLVHPYSAVWGKLLRPEIRAPLSPPR